jgi:alkylation response protein AidB-like acyl-CoA dehydrogenase
VDFEWGDAEQAYREETRRWLEANIPSWWRKVDSLDYGEDEHFERLRTWHQELFDAGYVGVTWPREFGGQGRSAIANAILQEELVRAGAPPTVNGLGIGLCGPALMHHGSDAQKARHLRPMLRAEQIWCQGYSEPGAGSDLASLQTRAERKGDAYLVNGQKIWTSGAHHADWCFCLVRTDPLAADRHGGIGFLLIDMRSPGVEVRPLVQITGTRNFNQVFFTDVLVPAENMVGQPTEGWRVANTVLSYERGANTLSRYVAYQRSLRDLIELTQRTRCGGRAASGDPVVRQRVAQLAIEIEILRLGSMREITRLSRGERPGPESSIQKLYRSELEHRLARAATSLQGPYAQLLRRTSRTIDGGRWGQREVAAFGGTIAAGTSEIQRNIIAERVLGLPRR